ncbi:S9 family peptidase [Oxalobacteraceae bacterium OM1]|nr:S9 family peptidase [Oxalobacteraceae bacterium OM1]
MPILRTVQKLALGILSAGITCWLTASVAAAEAIPVEAFFANPAMDKVELSPNGRYLAVQMARKDGRVMLATMDIETRKLQAAANFEDVDIVFFKWVNDDRLVFQASDHQKAPTAYGFQYSKLVAVNRDGSNFRRLHGGGFFATTRLQDSDDIFIYRPGYTIRWDFERLDLMRLNTSTGTTRNFLRPGLTHDWLIDQNNEPRVNVTVEGSKVSLHYKDDPTANWRKVHEASLFSQNTLQPAFFAPDGTLYVVARKDHDKAALYTFDPNTGRLGAEPVISLSEYDFSGTFFYDAKKLLGVRYTTDASATIWFDERMKQIQKEVDALLPATTNRITTSVRNETPYVVVTAYSDVDPGTFYLYHAGTHALDPIGKMYPAIDPKRMAPKDMVRYPARDGLSIPAYLSLPKGKSKNLPLVVLVHGGPWERGSNWGWDPEVQFLASRGYAVIQPEFRGSTNFGFKHFKAGWKQWGQAMQDDLADAAKWAIEKGIADPKRICIAGASYGGYATLMGLIKNPELFKCGVDWVGVTDIDLMYTATWSDLSEHAKTYGMPVLIGDPEKDAEQLKANSPIHLAAQLKQPLLMAYGGIDSRVPIQHGARMRDALKPVNPNVEWIQYVREGHGWKLVTTRVDFWSRVEKFLEANIGN